MARPVMTDAGFPGKNRLTERVDAGDHRLHLNPLCHLLCPSGVDPPPRVFDVQSVSTRVCPFCLSRSKATTLEPSTLCIKCPSKELG
jgi:hypothetical protein